MPDGGARIADPSLAETDARLIANGYEPVAVIGKRPLGDQWQKRPNTIEAVTAERERIGATSTGLRTGTLVGTDIDLYPPEHVAKAKRLAEQVLGATLMERIGSKGAMLCYRNETPIRKIVVGGVHKSLKGASGKPLAGKIELLGIGQQFVAYGTHPDTGQPYDWPNAVMEAEPLTTSLSGLPEVTPDQLRSFAKRAVTLLAQLGYENVTIADSGASENQPKPSAATGRRLSWDGLRRRLSWIHPRFDGARPDCYPAPRRKHQQHPLRHDGEGWLGIALCLRDGNIPLLDDEAHDWIELIEEWSDGTLWRERTGRDVEVADRLPWQGIAARLGDKMREGDRITTVATIIDYASDAGCPLPPDDEPSEWPAQPQAAGHDAASGEPNPSKSKVRLIRATGVQPVKIDWLWPGYIARGKLHLLGGGKGAGKSTLLYDLFARTTAGGNWPDGTPAPIGDALIWSGEDDFNDTILPRFLAAGGNPDRLFFIDGVMQDGVKRAFDPASDMFDLLGAIEDVPGLQAMMIDPIVLASAGDSHKNAETRRGLQPLVDLLNHRRIAGFGVTHFTKGTQGKDPIERITGTLAYAALSRVVFAAAKGEDEDGPRRFVRIGSNIGPSGGGFEYRLLREPLAGHDGIIAQRVGWGRRLTGSGRELIEALAPEKQSEQIKAAVFLEDQLKPAGSGGVMLKDLKAAAEAHSLAWRTVERAKATELDGRVVAKKTAGTEHGQWYWVWVEPAADPNPNVDLGNPK